MSVATQTTACRPQPRSGEPRTHPSPSAFPDPHTLRCPFLYRRHGERGSGREALSTPSKARYSSALPKGLTLRGIEVEHRFRITLRRKRNSMFRPCDLPGHLVAHVHLHLAGFCRSLCRWCHILAVDLDRP